MFLFVFLLNIFTVYIPFLLIGYFMPNFIRKTLLFGVAIPEEASNSQEAKQLTKEYKRNYLLTTIIIAFAANILALINNNTDYSMWGILPLIISMMLNYVYIHKKAKELKREKGWTANKKQVVIVDTSHAINRHLLSLHWFWIPISVLILTLLFTMIQYPHLPDKIPTHFDLYGNPTTIKETSFTTVFLLPLTQAFMTAMFFFISKMIQRAKPSINPATPKTSAIQNKLAKRYWIIYMIVVLIVLNVQFAYLQLNALTVIKPSMTAYILIQGITVIIAIFGAIFVAFKTGQSGSRIKVKETEEANNNTIDRDDDRFWKLGVIYYNPHDPSLFIEKRFGIGWTINYGRPMAIIITFALLVVIIGSLVLL
ncbi:DUF1648 domain-containing protein [Alkaliphilus pronyensis]|uniref:DUF1648 domain-containing protein n=1 Tax=Alkaliphilus pronyensis TaxID=1482732 RepID=A0A6I0EZC6_9FIRM|nr:DUF5808 domain-containing protein [Alkaliphilus pronyensis]KAB3534489.1 DUF1648 domain-containing protein [Alkaliphilus pronyensis]